MFLGRDKARIYSIGEGSGGHLLPHYYFRGGGGGMGAGGTRLATIFCSSCGTAYGTLHYFQSSVNNTVLTTIRAHTNLARKF